MNVAKPTETIMAALNRNWEMVDSALVGLDEATLAQRPTDQCNSIAWILWHMSRVVDTFIYTRFQARPQLWVRDRWYQKFGMSDDPEDRGVGWSAQQVAAWKVPPRQTLLGYYEAAKSSAREYLPTLTPADLDRQITATPIPHPRPLADVLGQMTWDNIAHGGQIAYLRGLYRGMGWHR
jgi:hypothetical protein